MEPRLLAAPQGCLQHASFLREGEGRGEGGKVEREREAGTSSPCSLSVRRAGTSSAVLVIHVPSVALTVADMQTCNDGGHAVDSVNICEKRQRPKQGIGVGLGKEVRFVHGTKSPTIRKNHTPPGLGFCRV